MLGENAESLFLDEQQKRVIDDEHHKRAKGIPTAYELSLKTKSGQKRWALISGAPKFDLHGEITGSIGIHVDITERKLNEQELFATKAEDVKNSSYHQLVRSFVIMHSIEIFIDHHMRHGKHRDSN